MMRVDESLACPILEALSWDCVEHLASANDRTIVASIVNVFPSPISSARIPPRSFNGVSIWDIFIMLWEYLRLIRTDDTGSRRILGTQTYIVNLFGVFSTDRHTIYLRILVAEQNTAPLFDDYVMLGYGI